MPFSQFILNHKDDYKEWQIVTLISGLANSLGVPEKEARSIAKGDDSTLEQFVIKHCDLPPTLTELQTQAVQGAMIAVPVA